MVVVTIFCGSRFTALAIALNARMVQYESTSHPSYARIPSNSPVCTSITISPWSHAPVAVLTAKKSTADSASLIDDCHVPMWMHERGLHDWTARAWSEAVLWKC